MLEKTLEHPLDCKEIKPINPKGIFIGRTHAKAKAPILRPPDAKPTHLEKTLMLRKTEGKRRGGQQRIRWLDSIIDSMGMTLSKLQGDTGGHGSLAWLQSMGHKVRHDLGTE